MKTKNTGYEKLEAMGQDNEAKAAKEVKKILKEEEAQEKERLGKQTENFLALRSHKQNYINSLSDLLAVKLNENIYPPNVSYRIAPTDQGVYMELYVRGRIFTQAFKASGEPVFDLNAVEVFSMRTDMMVNKLCSQTETN